MKLKPTPIKQQQPQTTSHEFRFVFEPSTSKKSDLSLTQAVVVVVAIIVLGAVLASGLYGIATNDYAPLRGIGESVTTAIPQLLKALK